MSAGTTMRQRRPGSGKVLAPLGDISRDAVGASPARMGAEAVPPLPPLRTALSESDAVRVASGDLGVREPVAPLPPVAGGSLEDIGRDADGASAGSGASSDAGRDRRDGRRGGGKGRPRGSRRRPRRDRRPRRRQGGRRRGYRRHDRRYRRTYDDSGYNDSEYDYDDYSSGYGSGGDWDEWHDDSYGSDDGDRAYRRRRRGRGGRGRRGRRKPREDRDKRWARPRAAAGAQNAGGRDEASHRHAQKGQDKAEGSGDDGSCGSSGFCFEEYYVRRQLAYEVVDDLIDQFLRDEIVPDLLIDVLSQPDAEFEVGSEMARVERRLVDDLVKETIPGWIREIVVECTNELVTRYLIERGPERRDPKEVAAENVFHDVLRELMHETVEGAVAELVEEYLYDARLEDTMLGILHETVEEMVVPVVSESVAERAMESVAGQLYDETVEDFVRLVAEDVYAEAQGLEVAEAERREFLAVSDVATSRILDDIMAQELLRLLADGGQRLEFEEYMDRTLRHVMAQVLFAQLGQVFESTSVVQENVLLRHEHERLTSEIALRFLVSQLKVQAPGAAVEQYEREARLFAHRSTSAAQLPRAQELDRRTRMSELRAWLSRRHAYPVPPLTTEIRVSPPEGESLVVDLKRLGYGMLLPGQQLPSARSSDSPRWTGPGVSAAVPATHLGVPATAGTERRAVVPHPSPPHAPAPAPPGDHGVLPPADGDHGVLPPADGDHGFLPPADGDHGFLPPADGDHGFLPPADGDNAVYEYEYDYDYVE